MGRLRSLLIPGVDKKLLVKDASKLMPDLASRSEAVTSSALFPIEDTTPRPVTTTRLIDSDLFILSLDMRFGLTRPCPSTGRRAGRWPDR